MEELEDYSDEMRSLFTSISVVFLIFTIVALVALNRTKHTPKTARFLSSALLLMDFLAVFTYTIRRYVTDPTTNVAVQVIGVGWTLLALITIGIMSIERLIVFNFANFYLKHVTIRKVKCIVIGTWVIESFIYFFIRYGVCYIMYPAANAYDVIGKCNNVSFIYMNLCLVIIIAVSITCYVKIFGNIRYQCTFDKGQRTLRRTIIYSLKQYKATSIVVVYLLTMITTTTVYVLLMNVPGMTQTARRINVDVINVFNCVMDPCMYVIWFRECRLEILKMFSCIIPKALLKIQKMRLEVLNIVTSDSLSYNHSKRLSWRKEQREPGIKHDSMDISVKSGAVVLNNVDVQFNKIKPNNYISPKRQMILTNHI